MSSSRTKKIPPKFCRFDFYHYLWLCQNSGAATFPTVNRKDFQNIVGIDPAGIEVVQGAEDGVQRPAYSIGGVKVGEGYKDIVIRGGKKMLVK